jgi:hypothetical protein
MEPNTGFHLFTVNHNFLVPVGLENAIHNLSHSYITFLQTRVRVTKLYIVDQTNIKAARRVT